MHTLVFFGPPGTGKTTHLLSCLESALNRYAPQEIAFVSFTRASVGEGTRRAKEKFGFTTSETCYFRTIHSLCYRALELRQTDIIQADDYKVFGDKMAMRFAGHYGADFRSIDDQYLFAEQLVRNNPVAGMNFLRGLDSYKYAYVEANYTRFKRARGLYDYTDLLQRYLAEGNVLPVKYAIIDEAQDLTPLQWRVITKMFSGAKYRVIAGDDDQAIYQWAGSDVNNLLNVQGQRRILKQSYRLPLRVYKFATNISKNITYRVDKVFKPRKEEGFVGYASKLEHIDINPYTDTLILARNNQFLDKVETLLTKKGIPFSRKGRPAVKPDFFESVHTYEDWREGRCSEADFLPYRDTFKAPDKSKPWFENVKAPQNQITLARAYLERKVPKALVKAPKIRLETIHSAKGLEADTVVLMLDMSRKVYQNFCAQSDSELRAYYVGATRAKNRLIVKYGEGKYSYNIYK